MAREPLAGNVVYKYRAIKNGTGSSGSDKLLAAVADNDKAFFFTNHSDSGVRFKNVNVAGAS